MEIELRNNLTNFVTKQIGIKLNYVPIVRNDLWNKY